MTSAPVQAVPEAHPTSCARGTGCFLGVKRPGRGLNYPPPFSTEVKERVELYICFPPWASMAFSRSNFTFFYLTSDRPLSRYLSLRLFGSCLTHVAVGAGVLSIETELRAGRSWIRISAGEGDFSLPGSI